MIRQARHIIWGILVLSQLFWSCKKEDPSTFNLSPSDVRIYDDANVKWAFGAVAGDGVALLVYVDNFDDYQFKLIDNNGEEIWTKNFGYKYSEGSLIPPMHIVFDIDGTFAIFFNNGLKKINMLGEVIFNQDDFLNFSGLGQLNSLFIKEISIGKNGSYLVMGAVNLSSAGDRALVVEFNREGQQNFLKTYTVNVNGKNAYTSAIKLDDGGYLVAGSFGSKTSGLSSAYFVSTLKADGTITKTIKTDVGDFYCEGRELLQLKNGRYAYLLSPSDESSADKSSRVYQIDIEGTEYGVSYIDFASANYGVGAVPFFGEGLIMNDDGSFSGLMKSEVEVNNNLTIWVPSSYKKPHYAYFYTLNSNAEFIGAEYLNKAYSNYYNAIAKLSNGKALLFGSTLSLGIEMKLSVIIR